MPRPILSAVALALLLAPPVGATDAQKPHTPKSLSFASGVCDDFLRSLAAREGVVQAWKAWEKKEGGCNSLDKSAKAQEVCRTGRALSAAWQRSHDEVRAGGQRVEAAVTSKTVRAVLKTVYDMMFASGPLANQIFEWKKETDRLADFLSEQPVFPALDNLVGKLPVTAWAIYDETLKAACRLGQVAK